MEGEFDAIVIGTGIGGGTLGRALAEAGMRVLFIEKGRAGHRAEANDLSAAFDDPFARSLLGLWPERLELSLNGGREAVFAPLGATLGGTSAFYAATLERPELHDLEAAPGRAHPTGGWPVGWAAFRPWFDAAERLFAVGGEADPLSAEPQPALAAPAGASPADAAIIAGMQRRGLHPYLLHSAVRGLPGCPSCLGRKCPRACKMDGRSAGVEPALATGRATLIDEAEVLRLIAGPQGVAAVELRRKGEVRRLSAPRVILAAGALSSPLVLLASACEAWPDGPGNGSGLVGRGLMFHFNELFALFAGRAGRGAGPSKSVGLRDFYHLEGQRLGMVQALGVEADEGVILHELRQRLGRSALGRARLLQEAARLPARAAALLLGDAKIFVGLLEDLPYDDNRVRPGAHPLALAVDYRIRPELEARRRALRRAIARALRPFRPLFLGHRAEPNLGHPCGTLRFGADPARSVLAPDCRVHGVGNLWATDAGFMPTSMGVNPSLTIAANALRVAASITGGRE